VAGRGLSETTGRERVNRLEGLFIALVFAHLIVVLVHTVAHLALQILPGPADTAFILAVILIAPVTTLPILRFNRPLASGLLAVAMAAAFAYGVQGHFLAPGPDNVSMGPAPWTPVFVATGAILGGLQLVSVIVAAAVFRRAVRTPSESPEQSG